MRHPAFCSLLLSLTCITGASHAQVLHTELGMPGHVENTEIASARVPNVQHDTLLRQVSEPFASLNASQAKLASNAVRAEVLEKLGATVRDTDLARLNDIYETH